MSEPGPPSPFLVAQLPALREAARLGPVLDLACGRGRHARRVAEAGCPTLALDRSAEALAALAAPGGGAAGPLLRVRTDLETEHGIPVRPGSCGAILVFRFLFRPLAAAIQTALAPGGLLLYETFTTRQRDLGRGPRNSAFLLEPGELPRLFPALRIEDAWEGRRGDPPEELAHLAARKV